MNDSLSFLGFSTAFETQDEGEVLKLKGFASVEKLDRSKDLVSPLEFNIDTFLNSGAFLVNHKRVRDELGNEVTPGRVNTANPVIIDSEKDGEYLLKDLRTKEFVNTYPKDKVPELSVGDRGLFITADVKNPSVKERIKSGELGALSWRGYTRRQQNTDGTNTLTGVDLIEISAVDMPDQNQSTFSVYKSVNGDYEPVDYSEADLEIYKFRFPKEDFSKEDVMKYAETHGLEWQKLSENDLYIFGGIRLECGRSCNRL